MSTRRPSPSTPAPAASPTSDRAPPPGPTTPARPGPAAARPPPPPDPIGPTQDGPDRVRVEGVRGEAPPPTLKVGLNRLGGFRNEVAFVLTGLDIQAKAALVREQMEPALGRAAPRGRAR